MRRLAIVLFTAMTVVAGCSSSGSDDAAPTVPTTVAETTTTVAPSTTTSTRPTTTTTTIPRTTTSTIVTLQGGEATLTGTVTGPAGPIDGATVRIERLVGKSVASADVTTAGGGGWQLASVLGGSYRVRAFKAPEFATSPVEAFFLAANERKIVDFKLTPAGGERITAVVSPSPPRVDQPATLTLTVGIGRVDDQGRPALTPRPNVLLTLAAGPGIVLESPPQMLTDGNGAAAWRIRCSAEGASTLSLTINNGATQVNIPPCATGSATATTKPS